MTTIKIGGMSCQHCVMAVTKALQKMEGIKNIQVSLDKGEASFDEDPPVDREAIRTSIRKAGFTIE